MKEEKDEKNIECGKNMLDALCTCIAATQTAFRSAAVIGRSLHVVIEKIILEAKENELLPRYIGTKLLRYNNLTLKEKVKIAQSFGFWIYRKKAAIKKFFQRCV